MDTPEVTGRLLLQVSLLWMRMSPLKNGVLARTTWMPSPT
jgi:hypothetical protein